jgi:hypothetical protein
VASRRFRGAVPTASGLRDDSSTLGPEQYALSSGSAASATPREAPGLHARDGWTRGRRRLGKGTLLTAYRKRLAPELYAEFLARYAMLLLHEVQGGSPFLFTFKRILVWGRR